jgi:hypothetical protein
MRRAAPAATMIAAQWRRCPEDAMAAHLYKPVTVWKSSNFVRRLDRASLIFPWTRGAMRE